MLYKVNSSKFIIELVATQLLKVTDEKTRPLITMREEIADRDKVAYAKAHELLKEDPYRELQEPDIRTKVVLKKMKESLVEKAVEGKYGPYHARIFRILKINGHLEDKFVSQACNSFSLDRREMRHATH